jgi:hypothetical protein
MSKQWDVAVTVDATMTAVVRGVLGDTPSEAAKNALQPEVLAEKASFEPDSDNLFPGWVRDAYLADPEECVYPHDPALIDDVKQETLAEISAVIEKYSHGVIKQDLMYRSSNPSIRGFLSSVRDVAERNTPDAFRSDVAEQASQLANLFREIADTLR